MENKELKFSGGGGRGGGSSSVRTPDSLRSEDTMEMILGICEGPIEGLLGGLSETNKEGEKNFFIGNTQLRNNNGVANFSDYLLEIFKGNGTDENVTLALGGSSRGNTVSVRLAQNSPITRQTQLGTIDYLDVRILINSLYRQDDRGVYESTFTFNIEYKKVTDPNWIMLYGRSINITGKTTSTYVKSFRWAVERSSVPYEIRITKLSADSDGTNIASEETWESYQEIDARVQSYPFTALCHFRAKASDQFSSVPDFAGIYKLLRVRVPINYDVENRQYNGVWDGTFKLAWTDNPVWCLYDFVMNNRYGVNAYYPLELDKWDCYEASQWCDELVSDGRGGFQPRYTCNMVISDARNGREQMIFMAGLFNAMLVEESTGTLRLKVDKEEQAVHLFAPENVVGGEFKYSFTDPSVRYNDITVAFTNPDFQWNTDRRRIFNEDDIEKNGRVTHEFAATGCIFEGEALRRAYYKLITSLTETMIINFSTNRLAQNIAPFDVILVSDPTMGYALTGRIRGISANRKIISLRDPIYMEAGIAYECNFDTEEGIYNAKLVTPTGSGSTLELEFVEPLRDIIPEYGVFSLVGEGKTGAPKPFRVISLTEESGNPDLWSVTAVEINRNKWWAADHMIYAEDSEYSGLPSAGDIPHVLDVNFTEKYVPGDGAVYLILGITLPVNEYPFYSFTYNIYSRLIGSATWAHRPTLGESTIVGHPPGLYEFIVLPKSTLGNTPLFNTAPRFLYEVKNLSDLPSDVRNFKAESQLLGIRFTWDPIPDLDLKGYEIRRGVEWETGEIITSDYFGTSYYYGLISGDDQTFMIKAVDVMNGYSVNAAYVTASSGHPEDVREFYITPQLDYLRFDWRKVAGADIEYIIRQGSEWDSALEVGTSKSNNLTVHYPVGQESVFLIKARTPLGKLSLKAKWARANIELKQNRNIILEVDNAKEGFPGITRNFEVIPHLTESMGMVDHSFFAEHYFKVDIGKLFTARSWLATEPFGFGSRLTWEDMHYTWEQPESHQNWMGSTDFSGKGEIEKLICPKSSEEYSNLLGFSLNGTLDDMTGSISPTDAEGISYTSARVDQGLVIGEDTVVIWRDINIPEKFSFTFKVESTSKTSENYPLLTLQGDNGRLSLYIAQGKVFMLGSDGTRLEADISWFSDLDFLTIGIDQTNSKRTLFASSSFARSRAISYGDYKPIGAFNRLKLKELV